MFNFLKPSAPRAAPPPGHPSSWWDDKRDSVKSCQFLNGNLVFGYDGICACCILPPGATSNPPFYINNIANKYTPSEIVDLIVKNRDDVLTKLQNETHGACDVCSFYKSYPVQELQRRPYAFDNLTMTYIEGCTLKCFYCYQAEPGFVRNKAKQLYEMPAIIREMFARRVLDPQCYTFWGGGEPTIGDDFDEVVELLSRNGGSQCLNTNALRLSRNVVDILKRDPNFALVCSVDAGTAPTYAKIKGFDVYERVMKNLGTYAQTGGRVTAKYIILEENYAELMDFGRQAVAAGVKDFAIDFDNRSLKGGRPHYRDEIFDVAQQFVQFIRSEGLGASWAGHSRGTLPPEDVVRVERMVSPQMEAV